MNRQFISFINYIDDYNHYDDKFAWTWNDTDDGDLGRAGSELEGEGKGLGIRIIPVKCISVDNDIGTHNKSCKYYN